MGGRQSKRIGKEGEREAKRTLLALGCHVAFTEIQGLAGDDLFVQDKHGRWWSVEVKNTTSYKGEFLTQAKRQARERYEAIQEKLNAGGMEAKFIKSMGLDKYTPDSFFVMWHPRNSNIALDTWSVYLCVNGRNRCRHLDVEEGAWTLG